MSTETRETKVDFFDDNVPEEELMFDSLEWEGEYNERRRTEALQIFVEIRKQLGDAFLSLDIVVLQPVCYNCRYRYGVPMFGSPGPVTAVLPQSDSETLRLYDAGSHHVLFFIDDDNPHALEPIRCNECGERVDDGDETGSEFIPVLPTPFCEFFGIEEANECPVKPNGAMRKLIRELYGKACLHCGSELTQTIDHIEPRSSGGVANPTNLQILCDDCNANKADKPAWTLVVAFDFPLRPAPSDSFDGLVW